MIAAVSPSRTYWRFRLKEMESTAEIMVMAANKSGSARSDQSLT